MSVTSFDGVYRMGVTTMNIAIGATAATWVTPSAGQIGWILEPAAMGGTFEIYPSALTSATGASTAIGTYPYANGTTQTSAFLAGMSGQGFYWGLTAAIPVLKINGPAQFYLGNSSGATVQVKVMSLFGQGY